MTVQNELDQAPVTEQLLVAGAAESNSGDVPLVLHEAPDVNTLDESSPSDTETESTAAVTSADLASASSSVLDEAADASMLDDPGTNDTETVSIAEVSDAELEPELPPTKFDEFDAITPEAEPAGDTTKSSEVSED